MATSTRLANKVCLVTGTSSGIGRAIALALAREGAAYVLCADLSAEPTIVSVDTGVHTTQQSGTADSLLATHELITQRHGDGKAGFWQVDVTVEQKVQDMIEAVVQRAGRLDVLVSNAGIGPIWTPLHETSDEAWSAMFNVNLRGSFLCSKHAIRQFLKQETNSEQKKRGCIINLASNAALREIKGCGPYSASKAGVVSLTKTTAIEYGNVKIQCNAICPGAVLTSMTAPLVEGGQILDFLKGSIPWGEGGLMGPDEIAHAAVWLASDESCWVTGIALPVDGGNVIHN